MKLKENQYLIERIGPIRTTRKSILEDQLDFYADRDRFENYIKKQINCKKSSSDNV